MLVMKKPTITTIILLVQVQVRMQVEAAAVAAMINLDVEVNEADVVEQRGGEGRGRVVQEVVEGQVAGEEGAVVVEPVPPAQAAVPDEDLISLVERASPTIPPPNPDAGGDVDADGWGANCTIIIAKTVCNRLRPPPPLGCRKQKNP